MLIKLLVLVLALSATTLTGCSSNSKVDQAEATIKQTEDFIDMLDKIDVGVLKRTGDNQVECTITNNSDYTLSYVEIDIFHIDKNDKVVNSEFSNWSGTLPPGAECVIDTYINPTSSTVLSYAMLADYTIKP